MTPDDPSDNALIAGWVIEAELDFSHRKRLDFIGGLCTRTPIISQLFAVNSDPAMADQQLFRAPLA